MTAYEPKPTTDVLSGDTALDAGEEDAWTVADYDPRLEPEDVPVAGVKRSRAGLILAAGGAAYIAALFALTPTLANIGSGSNDTEPVGGTDYADSDNMYNRDNIRPELIKSARRVVKLASKHPRSTKQYLRDGRIITTVSGHDDTDKAQIRLVTERHGRSRKLDPKAALSLDVIYKSDDGAGDRAFESVSLAAPHDEVEKWFAHEHTRYTSSGISTDTRYSSARFGDSEMIARDVAEILDDASFAIDLG